MLLLVKSMLLIRKLVKRLKSNFNGDHFGLDNKKCRLTRIPVLTRTATEPKKSGKNRILKFSGVKNWKRNYPGFCFFRLGVTAVTSGFAEKKFIERYCEEASACEYVSMCECVCACVCLCV